MKNFALIISFTIIALTSNAQVLGTLTTTVEGGVKGTETSFSPIIELYALDAANRNSNTLIFDANTVNGTDEVSFTITNNTDDSEFEAFANTLNTSAEHLLRIGHTIKGIKSQSASSINGWFGDDADFIGKNITHITITYKNITFNTKDNWTNFSYELEVKIFGNQAVIAEMSDK